MSKSIKTYTDKATTWYKKNTQLFWILVGLFLLTWLGTCIYISHTPKVPVPGIVKPDKEIIHDVKVVVDSKKVDSLQQIIAKKDLIVKDYKNKWLAAVAKNKANAVWVEGDRQIDLSTPDWKERAQDLTQDAANSDSLCNEVITALESKSMIQDSVIKTQQANQNSILKSFNELAFNSSLKDAEIKKINKSLRWQKVQNVGLKGAAVAALVFIIKSAIK